MRIAGSVLCACVCVLCTSAIGICQETEAYVKTTICQLKNDPSAYNHKLVEVSGLVSHAFEDFSLFDPACSAWPPIWLEYGGTSKSGTMYCCGVTADRHRPKELVVERIPIPLLANEQFQQFDKAIQPPFRSGQLGAVVHATLVGRFFAGKRLEYTKNRRWGGYGHMGCCTLLAIQEVKAADTENHTELDYGASADQPDVSKVGCGYRWLMPLDQTSALLEWQKQAEEGKNEWAFDDPMRVASEALMTIARIGGGEAPNLIRETQGRKVYEWKPSGNAATYMVVVSRPYWISFYSRDPTRVAWAVIAAYEISCEGKNSVIRLK